MKLKKIYHPEKYEKQVYPNWRIDKNLSWFNINQLIIGFILSNLMLMFLWKPKDYIKIINPFDGTKYWLPPRYAMNYHTIKHVEREEKWDLVKNIFV